MLTFLHADKPAERVHMWRGQSRVPLQHASGHSGWMLPMQATIMTDPGTADRTYIGPMTPELVEEIIKKVRPTVWPMLWRLRADSTLPTHSSVAMQAQLAV